MNEKLNELFDDYIEMIIQTMDNEDILDGMDKDLRDRLVNDRDELKNEMGEDFMDFVHTNLFR